MLLDRLDHGFAYSVTCCCFSSFCEDHCPKQVVPPRDRLSFQGTAHSTCAICMCAVEARASSSTLRTPCCKNAWFHRSCIQVFVILIIGVVCIQWIINRSRFLRLAIIDLAGNNIIISVKQLFKTLTHISFLSLIFLTNFIANSTMA